MNPARDLRTDLQLQDDLLIRCLALVPITALLGRLNLFGNLSDLLDNAPQARLRRPDCVHLLQQASFDLGFQPGACPASQWKDPVSLRLGGFGSRHILGYRREKQ